MKQMHSMFALALTLSLGAMLVADDAAVRPATPTSPPKQIDNMSKIPATPAAAGTLVVARPFTLDRAYAHEWSKEQPQVDSGMIIVVKVNDLEMLRPRQVAQPVLMVGAQVVEPMNVGYASGYVVALVPAPRKADGSIDLDLTKTPIFFGAPELPETIDQTWADAQRKSAESFGVRPASNQEVTAAKTAGGALAHATDRKALNATVGALVRHYAADETERADSLEGKVDATPRIVK
jgi:hypothetical protein